MKILVIYNNNKYVKDVEARGDYFSYACDLRDQIINGLDIEQFLKNAQENNSIKICDVEGSYAIINGLVYFYEYAFSMWECANDYHDYETNPDAIYPECPKALIEGELSQ